MFEFESTTVKFSGVSPRTSTVPSLSEPGKSHRVLLACDCKGFQFNGHCRHIAIALGNLAGEDKRRRRTLIEQRVAARVAAR